MSNLLSPNVFFQAQNAAKPAGGAYDAPPDTLVGWGGEPPPYSPPLDAFSVSAFSPPTTKSWLRL